jgi:hypothetical protein
MSLHKRNIRWKNVSLNQKILQIYAKGIEYAFVSDNNIQCHNFVWCKDFLHDVVYSCVNNRPFEIYKFKFDPSIDPKPDLNKIKLLITNPKDKKFESKIPDCLDFLNQIEKKLKIKKTIVRKCCSPPDGYESGVFLLEGSKRWLNSPPMVSLYSLLIRVGLLHTFGCAFNLTLEKIKLGSLKPYQKFDKKWLTEAHAAFEKIFRLGDKKVFSTDIKKNYPQNMIIDTVHNRLGIMGFANDIVSKSHNSPVLVPHWHKFK